MRVSCLVAATAALPGCAISYGDWIRYGPGRIGYSGSRIEYLEATPSPGTILLRGASVRFTTRVRYTMQQAENGRLAVWFTDGYGGPLPIDGIAREITRAVMAEATLSFDVAVPDDASELVVHVGVLASGERTASGDLQMTYRVRHAS